MTAFAMLFPGQGSQSVGMLAELAAQYPIVAETFDEAGQALDIDLWSQVTDGPAEALNQTTVTQPAMLAGGVAVWRVWQQLGGPAPQRLAGHSLGEYSALVAAEALSFGDAVRLVARRAALMQEAVPAGQGAMAAVLGLDDEVVDAICRESAEGQVVSPANYNSPGQVVIAGDANAVERAIHRCRDAGARRAMILPVSIPSHCALMSPAREAFAEALGETAINAPSIPVVHNVDLGCHGEATAIRQALLDQLSSPVQWTGTVRQLAGQGIDHFAECGPGKVLTGLGKRIVREAHHVALESLETMTASIKAWSEQGND